MGTYVVGDIHGCYKQWMELKSRIESEDSNAKLILVGDIIDRGPDSLKMIKWAMENITESGKYQMIIGNHEEEKIGWWDDNIKAYTRSNQLDSTDTYNYNNIFLDASYDRYSFNDVFKDEPNAGILVNKVIEWFRSLHYYKDINVNNQRFIIAHANIPSTIIKSDTTLKTELSKQEKDFIVWDRDIIGFDLIPDTILIHGHTPTISDYSFHDYNEFLEKRGKIYHTHNRYNIDCGAVFSTRYRYANLAALRLDDLKEFYLRTPCGGNSIDANEG